MPFYFFLWTNENERHVAEHGVTVEEFEEVVCDPESVESSRTSNRPVAFGYTSTGKYLAYVYDLMDEDTVLPVTAYEV